ncbi:MAG: dihydroorotase [Verrucomicrobium sp.]|nr:dihydroorotase [Verrucomicrobium sp.]
MILFDAPPFRTAPSRALLIKGGRVIDPASGRDAVGDVYLLDGKVADPAAHPGAKWETIDAAGKIVTPGLIDLHVHLREPGGSAKETIHAGTRAAAAGGFTTVVAMPNTSPVADGANTIAWMRQKAEAEAFVHVYTTGCLSQKMEGEALAPIGSLKRAGVVAVTDDGRCIQNNELMRRACEYAKMFDLPVFDHCQDYALTAGGVAHEGYWSTVLGLRGWPSVGEEIIVSRNAVLAEMTGADIHCQHLSSAGSVRLVREARKRGIPLSGEVTPHHLLLTDANLQGYDTRYKMNPPLRAESDRQALLEGVADGTITVLSSDHAPHCLYEKEVEFDRAPFGIIGLETELSTFIKALVEPKVVDWPRFVALLTWEPAKLLRLQAQKGHLGAGADADVTIIDPGLEWTVEAEKFESLSRNCPFDKMPLRGRATHTIVGGHIVWQL